MQENGETGIRTPDTGLTPYNGLANRRLQPLGHLSSVYASNFFDDAELLMSACPRRIGATWGRQPARTRTTGRICFSRHRFPVVLRLSLAGAARRRLRGHPA